MMDSTHYEKLGLLYLGKTLDGQETVSPLLYKNKYLTTHAVIIGMTGSGKTGLGIGLIEEAMMDDIPSIIIDPKGDMANLALLFPQLRPEDFEPWLDPADAARKNLAVAEYAREVAGNWQHGLASWGQGKERLQQLQDKAAISIYTPGSDNGIPVSILSGFEAPDQQILDDLDTLNAMVSASVTGLLSLIGLEADPLTSREHILLSSILLHHWRNGQDVDLETLIGKIVDPPFEKVGVFPMASFFPQSDRMKLAMMLNNVLASPSFESWLSGPPLDIQALLYGNDGKPRTSIFSIAHLSESERMFFVTLLLNRLVGWMRRQQGTSTLRALLYMDEIFGFFPPTSNPPSKEPMMILLKQARAYGLGVVLSTQNPVDLDYKGLSNIGTWFIGRLQTSQDQNKVLDGIVGASKGSIDKTAVRNALTNMKSRQFFLKSAHLNEPQMFETRWVMSYLKGPISIHDLEKIKGDAGEMGVSTHSEDSATEQLEHGGAGDKPILSETLPQKYLTVPVAAPEMIFEPWLVCSAKVRFYNARRNIDQVEEIGSRVYLDNSVGSINWRDDAQAYQLSGALSDSAVPKSRYYPLPGNFSQLKSFKHFEKEYADLLYQEQRLVLLRAPKLKLESRPGELPSEFSARISAVQRERREAAAEKLMEKFQIKHERLESKLQTALHRVEKEKSDVSAKKADTLLAIGSAVLGAFLGRKAISSSTISRTASGIRKAGQMAREKDDVRRAEEKIEQLQQEIADLQLEQQEAISELAEQYDPQRVVVEEFTIKPRRSDIYDVNCLLMWEMVPPRLDDGS